MADVTIESRMSQLEAAQAAHDAWFRRMERLMEQLHEEIARERREAERERREAERERAEAERRLQESRAEAARERREDERAARDLRRQIAALGDKFGGFAEGMALPSMERGLRERFGTTSFAPSLRSRRDGEEMELDALGYTADDDGIAVVVEVKSRLRADGIDQMLRTLARFPRFYPEHRGKKLIGVLAAVEAPPALRERVLREGLVLATIRDDIFDFNAVSDSEATLADCDVIMGFDLPGAGNGDRIDVSDLGVVWGDLSFANVGGNTRCMIDVSGSSAAEMWIQINDSAVLASAYTKADFIF